MDCNALCVAEARAGSSSLRGISIYAYDNALQAYTGNIRKL